jgi:glycosyltransferase involved in cell wall biosynthesis
MNQPRHEISICICTFRRPALLARLLGELQAQRDDELYALRVIVADNDDARSALPVVESAKPGLGLPVEYVHEPERNIALARNAAVAKASGDLVAFIDDDEFPAGDWLPSLVRCLDRMDVDGVLGPVRPHFEGDAPAWLVKSGLCERPAPATGTVIGPRDMRTGNALVKRALFLEDESPFDPAYGTIGGSDVIFFERMVARGRTFRWCNEGAVYESVSGERLTGSYYVRRALARGLGNSKRAALLSLPTLKSLAAFLVYTPLLPVMFVAGKHVFMKWLIRDCDHLGRLLGLAGIRPVEGRPYESLRKGKP